MFVFRVCSEPFESVSCGNESVCVLVSHSVLLLCVIHCRVSAFSLVQLFTLYTKNSQKYFIIRENKDFKRGFALTMLLLLFDLPVFPNFCYKQSK